MLRAFFRSFAQLLAWVSNYVEIRVDATKVMYEHRRPFPRGAQDIGTWQTVWTAVAVVAVATNAGLVREQERLLVLALPCRKMSISVAGDPAQMHTPYMFRRRLFKRDVAHIRGVFQRPRPSVQRRPNYHRVASEGGRRQFCPSFLRRSRRAMVYDVQTGAVQP